MDSYILPISAGISGIVEVLLTHPLDRIKTKMQELSLENKNSHFKNATKAIYYENGKPYIGEIKNFYLGVVPRIAGVIPMRLVYWSTMVKMTKVVKNQHVVIAYVVPGLVAGSVQTLLDNPIEVTKIQLMTKGSKMPTNLNVMSITGIKNLYAGFSSTIIRNSIFAVCVSSTVKKFGQKKENKFAAGAVGGFVGSLLSHPFDVTKTELQRYKNNCVNNKGTFQIMSEIIKTNPSQLLSGATMRCTLAFFNMGIGFCALGYIHDYMSQIWAV